MATPDYETVVVHLGPDRFTVGYYRIENNELQMLIPRKNDTGFEIGRTCQLKPDDNPKAIASVLTKEIRATMISPFWDKIDMGDHGIA